MRLRQICPEKYYQWINKMGILNTNFQFRESFGDFKTQKYSGSSSIHKFWTTSYNDTYYDAGTNLTIENNCFNAVNVKSGTYGNWIGWVFETKNTIRYESREYKSAGYPVRLIKVD